MASPTPEDPPRAERTGAVEPTGDVAEVPTRRPVSYVFEDLPSAPSTDLAKLGDVLVTRWRWTLAGLASLIHVVSILAVAGSRFPFPLKSDAAVYQHGGWAMHQGRAMYREVWGLKPPLSYEVPAALSAMVGGDVLALHLLSVVVTVLASIGTVLLVGQLVHDRTGSPLAALLAGLVPLTFAWFAPRTAFGFAPKYFTFLLGLASICLLDRGKSAWAGASAVASAGFWQFGAIFPLIVAGSTWRSTDHRRRALAGGAIVAAAAIAPIVLSGAFVPMVVEVAVIPLLVSDATPLLVRGGRTILFARYALLALAVGGLGAFVSGFRRGGRWWCITALAAWVGAQIAFMDFDGPADLLFPAVVAGIGFGYVFHELPDHRQVLTGVVAVGFLALAFGVGGWGIVYDPITETRAESREDPALVHRGLQILAGEPDGEDPTAGVRPDIQRGLAFYGGENMQGLYWNEVLPETCHSRLGNNEIPWLEETGRPFRDLSCGEWPSGMFTTS